MEQYIAREGIDALLEASKEKGILFDAQNNLEVPAIPPQVGDLCRLHALIRENHSFTVLEFGVGYSTVIIADALAKNKADFANLPDKPQLGRSNIFMGYCVDANETWIERCKAITPDDLTTHINIMHSGVTVGTFNGGLCHYYDNLPNIVADFIYLDGPDPADVKGKKNGMDFATTTRTVMAADLLLMEPTLLPGTIILIDGRTNNARFLERNFQRPFIHEWNEKEDYTTLTLDEPRLGPKNIFGNSLFVETQ